MEKLKSLITLCEELGCPAKEGEPMSRHTTMRVGGPAQLFVQPYAQEQIAELIAACKEVRVPWHVIGNGSNLLVSDEGVAGMVIALGPDYSEVERLSVTQIYADAGASLAKLCEEARKASLSGLEFAWGIPASVGGAVYMNAGAYLGEIKDVLLTVEHLTPEGTTQIVQAEDLDLRYRHSAYMENGCVILGATFMLEPKDPDAIKARMDELMGRRRDKQPLEHPSCGSTFKRPEGAYAAALIEQCGLKGLRVGGASVSEKHSGFIVNDKGATCKDILELIGKVQHIVLEQTGYHLECEVKQL